MAKLHRNAVWWVLRLATEAPLGLRDPGCTHLALTAPTMWTLPQAHSPSTMDLPRSHSTSTMDPTPGSCAIHRGPTPDSPSKVRHCQSSYPPTVTTNTSTSPSTSSQLPISPAQLLPKENLSPTRPGVSHAAEGEPVPVNNTSRAVEQRAGLI